MLDLLHQRLPNPPEQEITLAAEEQRRITALRLQQWLEEFDG
jgi:2-oxo-4-hydroxy-4-carboxy--5-ureidoimidazoline (OHCU) decarboxylase